jgi:hypothetical protein
MTLEELVFNIVEASNRVKEYLVILHLHNQWHDGVRATLHQCAGLVVPCWIWRDLGQLTGKISDELPILAFVSTEEEKEFYFKATY